MSIPPGFGPLGAGLVVACVVAYWVYSFGVIRTSCLSAALAWPLRVRLPAVLLGTASALLSLDPLHATVALVGAAYALTRQWAWPRLARGGAPRLDVLCDDELVVVLPDGTAVPVGWLEAVRTVRLDGRLIVACSLARSLAAFEDPGPVAPSLPLAVGFEILGAAGRWHGVTGEARGGGRALRREQIRLVSYAQWRRQQPGATLMGPARGPIPRSRLRRTRLPGAVQDPTGMERGVVDGERWTVSVLDADEGWFVARWAGRRLGIPGA